MSLVRFRFIGGMADDHEMNFYEFGRFQYGAARFIYTLEDFRLRGRVSQKLTKRVNTDVRVRASTEGSFIQDVLVFAVPVLAEAAIHCHFEVLFAYIWDKILPSSKGHEVAVEIARQEVQREEQRTLQETQRTEQTRLLAEVANNNAANTTQALNIIQNLIDNPRIVVIQGNAITTDQLVQYQSELSADIERKRIIATNADQLTQITPDMERRLTSQLRKAFADISKPLKSSANEMQIISGEVNPHRVATIDQETANRISKENEDDNITLVRGSIKAFDRENYNGRLRYDDLDRPIPFSVRANDRQGMRTKVLAAMGREDAWLRMYLVRDAYRTPVRAILEDILEDEDDL